ncbi:MAG: hypothetical protein WAT78_02595 [Rhizobiaceae bacterium]
MAFLLICSDSTGKIRQTHQKGFTIARPACRKNRHWQMQAAQLAGKTTLCACFAQIRRESACFSASRVMKSAKSGDDRASL